MSAMVLLVKVTVEELRKSPPPRARSAELPVMELLVSVAMEE